MPPAQMFSRRNTRSGLSKKHWLSSGLGNTLRANATAKITAAKHTLAGSSGKVLSEETRAAFTTPDVSFFSPGGGLRADTRTFTALNLGTVSELTSSLDSLLPTQQAVVAATTAWKTGRTDWRLWLPRKLSPRQRPPQPNRQRSTTTTSGASAGRQKSMRALAQSTSQTSTARPRSSSTGRAAGADSRRRLEP